MVYTIKQAVEFIVSTENIRTKEDLKRWFGDMGNKKMYLYVKRLASEHWNSIQTPENSTRFYYQKMVSGYKLCKLD